MNVNFPAGDDLGSATVRGASILAIYRQMAGDAATAESLVCDVMAAVQADAGWRLAEAAEAEDVGETTEAADAIVAEAGEMFEEMVGAAIDAALATS